MPANSSQRGDWKTDGKPETPNITSIKLLLDWWLDCPKCETFCGKGNEGVKKTTTCKELAHDMHALTASVNQTGENVKSKIVHVEGDFRKTHGWSTGETGAGILERDDEATWNEALANMFECCFDLLPIMGDRASSQPKFTDGNPTDLDADLGEEDNSFHPCDRPDHNSVGSGKEPVVAVVSHVVPSVVDGVVAVVVADGVVAVENAAEKPATKKTRAPPNPSRGPSPLMDASTPAMFNSVTAALAGKLTEMAHHNAVVETNNAAMLALAASKASADKMKTRYDCVKGCAGLVTQHKELKGQGLSENPIVAFIPHLKDVDKRQFFPVKSTANKGGNATKAMLKTKFPTLCFTNKADAILRKFETYEHCTTMETLPCLSNVPTRLTSSLARLIARCTCFVIVMCSCCHTSTGTCTIVTEHGVGTQCFVPFLCSGFDLASLSLGCTAVPGLELGTRIGFLD